MQLHDFDIYSIVLPVPIKILSLHLRNIKCTAKIYYIIIMSNLKTSTSSNDFAWFRHITTVHVPY